MRLRMHPLAVYALIWFAFGGLALALHAPMYEYQGSPVIMIVDHYDWALLGFLVSCFLRHIAHRPTILGLGWIQRVLLGIGVAAALTLLWVALDVLIGMFILRRHFETLPVEFIIGYLLYMFVIQVAVYSIELVLALDTREKQAQEQKRLAENAAIRAQLEMLQFQLQPHFLFNTLSAISGLISSAPEQAQEAIVELSELLRASVSGAHTIEVPLREELAIAKVYLRIQQRRFPHLNPSFAIEKELEETHIAPFTLQPLLENAIQHGTPSSEGALRLSVLARRDDDTHWSLSVVNSGALGAPRIRGVGLRNLRSRLATTYGDAHDFCMEELEGNVHARIRIRYEALAHPSR